MHTRKASVGDHVLCFAVLNAACLHADAPVTMTKSPVTMTKSPVTTASSPRTTCPKCAKLTGKNSGKLSCCAHGGAWFNKCGKTGDPNFDHTWSEGAKACEGKFSSSDLFELAHARARHLVVTVCFVLPC